MTNQQAPTPRTTSGIDAETVLLVRRGLRANAALNLTMRTLLGGFGLVCALLAVRYVDENGQRMVDGLSKSGADGHLVAERMLILTAPVLLLVAAAGLAAAAVWAAHSRGQEETFRTLDTLSRLKREGDVAVSARALMFAFEEKIHNARRAFMLLLWFGRTLFVICLGLFAVAVMAAILDGSIEGKTLVLGATSVLGALLAVCTGAPQTVKRHLADVIQVQTIVTGCDRQISLLETDAMAALNDQHATQVRHAVVLEVQARIGDVVREAVELLERHAVTGEPGPEGEAPPEVGRALHLAGGAEG